MGGADECKRRRLSGSGRSREAAFGPSQCEGLVELGDGAGGTPAAEERPLCVERNPWMMMVPPPPIKAPMPAPLLQLHAVQPIPVPRAVLVMMWAQGLHDDDTACLCEFK